MKGIALPTRQLVSQADSAHIEAAQVPRSKFINTWTRKTSCDFTALLPILVDEILPGDHMRYDVTAYVRMTTPLFPQFDNIRVDTFFFFVPCRLVWDNWVKFMGEQANPGDSIAYTVPVINDMTLGGENVGQTFDHMGVPVAGQIAAGQRININALPFRAYNLIYNEWFRDENLSTRRNVPKGDGPDTRADYAVMAARAKRADYFTTALPWPQKFTAPTVPIGGLAPVIGIGKSNQLFTIAGQAVWETNAGGTINYPFSQAIDPAAPAAEFFIKGSAASGATPQIYADLAATSGVAINVLRQAWLVQQLLERDARGGTRYVELIRSHFGVINPDFRLQRPEYIGGGQSPLNITPIAQTAPTTGVPLGALGGAGTAAGTHNASYAATEHGYVIGIMNVTAELSYQQGLHKMWTRSTRYDFYWPSLAGLGEQAVLTKEIYATGVAANDDIVFGYQERWQEYRTRVSEVTGKMRSTAAGTLDAWHLAQRFTAAPVLNNAFILDIPPQARIAAAGSLADNQYFLCDIMYQRTATRPIPTFGTPAILGRF